MDSKAEIVRLERIICPLNNQLCGLGSGETFSCVNQCFCPYVASGVVVPNLKFIYCIFTGSLCKGLVIDRVSGVIDCLCRDFDECGKLIDACDWFDGFFLRVLLRIFGTLDSVEVIPK